MSTAPTEKENQLDSAEELFLWLLVADVLGKYPHAYIYCKANLATVIEGDRNRGRPESSLFDYYYTKV